MLSLSQESLVKSEQALNSIQEEKEAGLKRFEKEKAQITDTMAELESRLQKALQHTKLSMVKHIHDIVQCTISTCGIGYEGLCLCKPVKP